jgi:hypothetical protein
MSTEDDDAQEKVKELCCPAHVRKKWLSGAVRGHVSFTMIPAVLLLSSTIRALLCRFDHAWGDRGALGAERSLESF